MYDYVFCIYDKGKNDKKVGYLHMNIYCNPINFGYRYQFNGTPEGGVTASREAADPSMVYFKGTYYIFPSMTAGFLHSKDMVNWELFTTTHLPIYDYAPDVRVCGDYLYFCASSHDKGIYYRTTDPFSDTYETFDGAFPFWDPNLFVDDDGRFYFFWGSSTSEPLYGVELDPASMQPIGEKQALCEIDTEIKGFERNGENHKPSHTPEEQAGILAMIESQPMPESMKEAAKNYLLELPYMEGVWVNKHAGKYYLQYATPSSGHNIYNDAVYISDAPLGPYVLAQNNPYSYKPGGFLPGAGHGSTMEDEAGRIWHTSTMRICKNHNFERRIGLWSAGYDANGDLFCNQRYGDWPQDMDALKADPWADPEWMLLSYGAGASASSVSEKKIEPDPTAQRMGKTVEIVTDYAPANATDENVQTWWKAASEDEKPWLQIDLGKAYDIHAIQINFADDAFTPDPLPDDFHLNEALMQQRWIDTDPQKTRWLLEGSVDGTHFFTITDKRNANTDLPHDLIVSEDGIEARFIRLTVTELPYDQTPAISGLRIFGLGDSPKPQKTAEVTFELTTALDLWVNWAASDDASGHVINWGYAPDKLYHSYMTFDDSVEIGGLIKDQSLFLRVDAFNESGITRGDILKVR